MAICDSPVIAKPTLIFVIQGLGSGGAEKQLLLTARYLAAEGYSCYVFPLRAVPAHPRVARLLEEAQRVGVLILQPNSCSGPRRFLALQSLARRNKQAIIWSWGTRADLICKLLLSFDSNHPFFLSLRDADEPRIRQQRPLYRLLESRVTRYVRNSWLNCEFLSRIIPGVLPKCRVIYNTLEPSELAQEAVVLPALPGPLRVLMLGNIKIRKKGYDLVVEVAADIKREGLPIIIEIAGRGDEAQWLNRQISERDLDSVLKYSSEAKSPVSFLRSGHAFLLMSRMEGTPNALLEAMNLGLPCISTKVGDVERFSTDRVNIRQLEVGDIPGAVSVLKEFLSDWESARRLGAAGRELCQRQFTPSRLLENTTDLLREIWGEAVPNGSRQQQQSVCAEF